MKVAVLFGGKSVEHEISVIGAISLCKQLKLEHEVIPIYITKENKMIVNNNLLDEQFYLNPKLNKKDFITIINDDYPCVEFNIFPFKKERFDIAILCVHGKGMEDGTLSAYLDFLNIPYVGPSTFSSSLAQNKGATKKLLKSHKVNMIDFEIINKDERKEIINKKIEKIGFPLIIKANNLGSSIGVSKVNNINEFYECIDYILKYDEQIIIEKYIINRKEYNISLFKNLNDVEVSYIEEVFGDDILSYENKYLENGKGMEGCKRICPACIKNSLKKEIEYIGKKVYYALDFKNLVRIDFIYDEEAKTLYFNEVNSIPGSYAHYLYKHKYTYLDLLNILIKNALQEYLNKRKQIFTINNNQIYKQNIFLKMK